jgi:hypothetical protein
VCVPSSAEQADCVADLELLAREAENGKCATFLAVSLESKQGLCVQPGVKELTDASDLENACRSATVPWSRPTVHSFGSANNPAVQIGETNGGVTTPAPSSSRCSFFDRLTLGKNRCVRACVSMSLAGWLSVCLFV